MNFESLNDIQKSAVQEISRPVLVFAGAGSGKTRVLTYKITYLMEEGGYLPQDILAVTFTNKAANEMKNRVQSMLPGIDIRWMNVGTFHSVAARILRTEASLLGYTSSFTIYDTDDSRKLLKNIITEMNLDKELYNHKKLHSKISYLKNHFKTPEIIRESGDYESWNKFPQIYQRYQEELKNNNAMDFDELLLKPIQLFNHHPDRLSYYQQRFKYILVDEYQDTNRPQFEFIRLLAEGHGHVTIVGDDDQSIYGWRGADVNNILNFESSFPGVRIFKLEQNYRSTQNILDAAHAVVVKNSRRAPKKLWTDNPAGEKLIFCEASDERDEAAFIVSRIGKEYASRRHALRDFAILYRTNAQSRALEEKLIRSGIPYTVVGGMKFYERKEVKDLLAYLRLIVNPQDNVSFERIINFPNRGLGTTTLNKIKMRARESGVSYYEALKTAQSIHVGARQKNTMVSFMEMMERLKDKQGNETAAEITETLVEELELKTFYNNKGTIEDSVRWDNVEELIESIRAYSEDNPDGGLPEYLEQVSLQTDIDNWNESDDQVTLMTVHSAKGLEFPMVIVSGLEEGLFPLPTESPEEEDEERRLFYVAITRAKEQVILTCATYRRRFGGGEPTRSFPSSFIFEIPEELIEHDVPEDKKRRQRQSGYHREPSFSGGYSQWNQFAGRSKAIKKSPSADVGRLSTRSAYQTGQVVEHKLWGKGKILSVEGTGENTKVTILFTGKVRKKLIARYASLKVIS